MFKIQKFSFILFFIPILFFLFSPTQAQTASRQSFFIPPNKYDSSVQTDQEAAILLANRARADYYAQMLTGTSSSFSNLPECLLKGNRIGGCLSRACPGRDAGCLRQARFKTHLLFFISAVAILLTLLFLLPALLNACLSCYARYLKPGIHRLALRLKKHTSRHTLEDVFSAQAVPAPKQIKFKINKFVLIELFATVLYSSIFSILPTEDLFFSFGCLAGNALVLIGVSYLIARLTTPKKEDRPTVAHTVFWVLLLLNTFQQIHEGAL